MKGNFQGKLLLFQDKNFVSHREIFSAGARPAQELEVTNS